MKGNLYFINRFAEKNLIGENVELDKISFHITDFIKSKNPDFKIYYMRSWAESSDTIMYDVGSHSEFFMFQTTEEKNNE